MHLYYLLRRCFSLHYAPVSFIAALFFLHYAPVSFIAALLFLHYAPVSFIAALLFAALYTCIFYCVSSTRCAMHQYYSMRPCDCLYCISWHQFKWRTKGYAVVVLKCQNVTLPLYMTGAHMLGPATKLATELTDKLYVLSRWYLWSTFIEANCTIITTKMVDNFSVDKFGFCFSFTIFC